MGRTGHDLSSNGSQAVLGVPGKVSGTTGPRVGKHRPGTGALGRLWNPQQLRFSKKGLDKRLPRLVLPQPHFFYATLEE